MCAGSNPACGMSEICGGENVGQWVLLEITQPVFTCSNLTIARLVLYEYLSLLKFNNSKTSAIWIFIFDKFGRYKLFDGGINCLKHTNKKKTNFIAPIFMDGVQLPQG